MKNVVDFDRIRTLKELADMMRRDAELCSRFGETDMAVRFAKEAELTEQAIRTARAKVA